jgi:hypothetical protein
VDVALCCREVGVAGEVAHMNERNRRVVGEAADPGMPERVKDDRAVVGDRQRRALAGIAERSLDVA